jgi:hypothetical protein
MNPTAHRLITTRLEFHDALREALADMALTGCREAWMCDENFADWPLNEGAVVEHFSQWAQSHRKLVVVARHFDEVSRRHPRWADWRRQWSHIVECRAFQDAEAGEIPTLLLADGLVSVRLFDPLTHRGALSRERADFVRYRELADAVSQRAVESFPPTILGL